MSLHPVRYEAASITVPTTAHVVKDDDVAEAERRLPELLKTLDSGEYGDPEIASTSLNVGHDLTVRFMIPVYDDIPQEVPHASNE